MSSQGGERVEVDLDGESDLDVTEVGHVLPAIRKTQTAGAKAGAGGVAEGASPASSVSSRKADNGISSITDSHSSSRSSSSNGRSSSSSGSSSSSSNTDNGDAKVEAARAAGMFLHSQREKRTDRGGTARYPHSKAGVHGPSRGNTE